MSVFAYCCASFAKSVRKAAGVQPVLSPPTTWKEFVPDVLTGRSLIYFKLHGLPNQSWWYGDDWTTALHADVFRTLKLKGTIVFVANCYLEESPFLDALLSTGATIIGSSGPNYAEADGITGADLLGYTIRVALERHARPSAALHAGKLALLGRIATMRSRVKRLSGDRRTEFEARIHANEDTLQFRIYT